MLTFVRFPWKQTDFLAFLNGKISLLVGHHVEPAFEDSFNAVDVILSTFDGACPVPNTSISIGQPIDADGTMAAKDPDTVNLQVDALYFQVRASDRAVWQYRSRGNYHATDPYQSVPAARGVFQAWDLR
jgi:hypothetical protein